MIVSILRFDHYGEKADENKRMTLSPSNICGLAAGIEDVIIQGRSLRRVAVLLVDGGQLEVTVNHSDLELLERAVGSFLEAD